MFNKVYLFIVLINIQNIIYSQDFCFELENKHILVADSFWGVDDYDNIYYTKDQVLFVKNQKNNLNYQNPQLGNISHIDITNPLKIVLYYKTFNTIILLDNQLNLIKQIDLPAEYALKFVSHAGQDQLWYYEENTNRFGRVDLKTNRHTLLTNPLELLPKSIHSDYNQLIWLSNNQLNSVNFWGQKKELTLGLNLPNPKIVSESIILSFFKSELFFFNYQKEKHSKKYPFNKEIKSFFLKEDNLFIFTGEFIFNYKIIS